MEEGMYFWKKRKYLVKNHRPVYAVTCIYLWFHYWGVYIKLSYSQVTSKQEKHSLMKVGGTELSPQNHFKFSWNCSIMSFFLLKSIYHGQPFMPIYTLFFSFPVYIYIFFLEVCNISEYQYMVVYLVLPKWFMVIWAVPKFSVIQIMLPQISLHVHHKF